ncbi:MAG: DUF362 domain-containing protein [Firmicutes bacterium]|nr:DUF362 domain-containing protein [Bacillota bacterium]
MSKSKVWFIPVEKGDSPGDIDSKVIRLFETAVKDYGLIEKDDFVAMKIHFGERDNTGYVKPDYLKTLVSRIKDSGAKPFFTDANTLYKGQRSNSVDHLIQAYQHGFTLDKIDAPVIIADGLMSKNFSRVEIAGKHFEAVNIANDILHSDVLIGISHLTGHVGACMGASIKNIGMGCASRSGKQLQHADVNPSVSADDCTACGQCVKWCPVEAIKIIDGNAVIDYEKCYGCAECITTCRFDAITVSWGGTSKALQEKMAEYALGVIKDKRDKSLFFNFLIHISKGCDCLGDAQDAVIEDIGILLSVDPLAVDQASVDLLNERAETDFLKELWSESGLDYRQQLDHAAAIGLGSREYNLIEL